MTPFFRSIRLRRVKNLPYNLLIVMVNEHVEQPTLTIITVVLNDDEGLRRTAQTLLGSLSRPVNWLIVDGHSTKTSGVLLETLRREPNVSVVSRTPAGIYDAMNYGWRMSNGVWAWFINAGDVLLSPRSVTQALELIGGCSDKAIIGTPVFYISPTRRVFSIAEAKTPDVSNNWHGAFHHQGALIRCSAIASVGGFRTDLEISSDGALIDAVVRGFPSATLQVPLVGFFPGGASTRRHSQALRETNSFRPGAYPLPKRLELAVKNRGMRVLIWASETLMLKKIVDEYLKVRERRILASFAAQCEWNPEH